MIRQSLGARLFGYSILMTRILGIDPGLRITGYGLVDLPTASPDSDHPLPCHAAIDPVLVEAGVIRLDDKALLDARLVELYQELVAIIAESRPSCLVVENLYAHYKHPRTAILMGHARGVILLAARQHGLAIQHLPATEVKKAITGYGRASKQQIQLAIQTQYRLPQPPSPPDVADAIAIATTYARRIALGALNPTGA